MPHALEAYERDRNPIGPQIREEAPEREIFIMKQRDERHIHVHSRTGNRRFVPLNL
jgi:hypothetical protein